MDTQPSNESSFRRSLQQGFWIALALTFAACSDASTLAVLDGGSALDAQPSAGQYDECGNGMDDDLDSLIDEGCFCGLGETQRCFSGLYPNRAIGICSDGMQTCQIEGSTEFGFWGACEGDVTPAEEVCGDGEDNDCDAAVDEGCACSVGETWDCGEDFVLGPCQRGTQVCLPDGTRSDCQGAIGPSAEVCEDDVDNDCDGAVNEGCGCIPVPEVCADGEDNDCDGEVDEPSCEGPAPQPWILESGEQHVCANDSGGHMFCWGANGTGQLGDGTLEDRSAPTPIAALDGATRVSASAGNTCAIGATGATLCWGGNAVGQLGDGTTDVRRIPTPVVGLEDAIALVAGTNHSCAVRSGGRVTCWGANDDAQLGDPGLANPSLMPAMVPDVSDATGVAVSLVRNTLSAAVHRDGSVSAWGTLIRVDRGTPRALPHLIEGLSDILEIDSDREHVCALRRSGEVYCWGRNVSGNLGDGTFDDRYTPAPVQGLTDAIQVRVGLSHSCALRATGEVVCWGSNRTGQLGDGTQTSSPLPVPVLGLTDVVDVAPGGLSTCARVRSGDVYCWGGNIHGQLGSDVVSSLVPMQVAGLGG